ncbi:hypothetical protein PGTUg99_003800 [Puccinia graminis f. sp. tritici]|uniref:Uncharacterized protein n=1 Tax=Puccinia graminis f. sp. tritici TaxID=56615 RepID=A0A5B0R5W6_PUCGR|nr:hypothetical protein PGTUg99_003800 [Puccinia graminis f. sp. tritici]
MTNVLLSSPSDSNNPIRLTPTIIIRCHLWIGDQLVTDRVPYLGAGRIAYQVADVNTDPCHLDFESENPSFTEFSHSIFEHIQSCALNIPNLLAVLCEANSESRIEWAYSIRQENPLRTWAMDSPNEEGFEDFICALRNVYDEASISISVKLNQQAHHLDPALNGSDTIPLRDASLVQILNNPSNNGSEHTCIVSPNENRINLPPAPVMTTVKIRCSLWIDDHFILDQHPFSGMGDIVFEVIDPNSPSFQINFNAGALLFTELKDLIFERLANSAPGIPMLQILLEEAYNRSQIQFGYLITKVNPLRAWSLDTRGGGEQHFEEFRNSMNRSSAEAYVSIAVQLDQQFDEVKVLLCLNYQVFPS